MSNRPPTISNSFKSRQIEVTEKLNVTGSLSATSPVVIDTSSPNAALRVTQRGSGNVIEIEDSTNPDSTPLVINSIGQIIIGLSAVPLSGWRVGDASQQGIFLVSNQTDTTRKNVSIYRLGNSTGNNGRLRFIRARGTTTNSLSVTNGDQIGGIAWFGYVGPEPDNNSEHATAAHLICEVDGTPTLSSVPGRFIFSTWAPNSQGLNTRRDSMVIRSSGNVGIGTTSPNELLTVAGNISATGDINISGRILLSSIDLFDLLTTSEFVSGIQTLSFEPSSYELSISLSNTVNLSSLNTTFAENSAKYEENYTTVNLNSSLWTTGYAIASSLSSNVVDTVLEYLSTTTNNVVISSIKSEIITTNTLNVPVTVITVSGTKVFTDTDSNKIIHFNTTSTSVCAVFSSSLIDGFNVGIMNTGVNTVVLSCDTPLKTTGTTIVEQYGGAFIYKQNNDIFAVGKLV